MTSAGDDPDADEHLTSETTARTIQTRALSGWIWTMAYVGAMIPLNFVVNALVARSLGATGYGTLAYLTTVLGLGQAIITLGFGAGVARYCAVHHGAGDREPLLGLLRSHNTINTLWTGTLVAIVIVAITRPSAEVAVLLVATSYLSAYMESSSLVLPAIQRSDRAAQAAAIGTTALNLGVVAAALITHDPETVFVARFVIGAVLAPMRLLFLPPDVRRACVTFGRARLPRELLKFGFVTYISGLLGMLVYSRTEVILLDLFGHAEAVGLFALAFGLAAQVTAPVDAAIGPLTPAMTSLIARDPTTTGRLIMRSYRAVLTSALLWAALVIVPLTALIPFIYGSEFVAAAPVFVFAAVASFIQSITAPNESFANATGRPGLPLRANLVGFVVGTGLAILLIPPIGLYGAVAGSIAGQLVTTVVLLSASIRRAKLGWPAAALITRGLVLLVVIGTAGLAATVLSLWLAALLWVLTLALTLALLRSRHLLKWHADEVQSVLQSAPRALTPFLRIALPRF